MEDIRYNLDGPSEISLVALVGGDSWTVIGYVVSAGGGGPDGHEATGPLDGPDGHDSKDFPSLKFVIIAGHISKVGRCSHLRPIQGRSQRCFVYKESMKRTSKQYDSESFGYIVNLLIIAGCT